MPHTPPVVVSSQRLLEGRVFDVDRDRLQLADGRQVDVDIVRHRASVVLIPMPSVNEIILVRQYRHAVGQWLWELPAGSSDPGEDPAAAAARECHEEIGLRPATLTRLAELFPTPGFCDESMVFYLAEGLHDPGHAAAQDEDEELEPRAFSLSELEAMSARGEVQDMKTLVGLQLLATHTHSRRPAD
ncbi:MAG: NUDIX hydrolase [Acidobacteriota bacterium]|nr:NUDIX hydrolase [Acidobacteriota bacterium]